MPSMNDQTRYTDVNGIRIAYERGGRTPRLINNFAVELKLP